MVKKSISAAKSTVTGLDEEITETGAPPPWGVKLALVMVTSKETTSQMGESPPKIATEPLLAFGVDKDDMLLPPQLSVTRPERVTSKMTAKSCFRIVTPPGWTSFLLPIA
jgi:hypothetical protein